MLDRAALIFEGEILSASKPAGTSDRGPQAMARIVNLYMGEPSGDLVSFRVPGAIVGSAEGAALPGLDISEGDRGLIILEEMEGAFVQTNVGCQLPWPEHLEPILGGGGDHGR